jgi:hypothetical protein
MEDSMVGLAILTCYHMEEGKVLSSMAGSQDALLPIPIEEFWQQVNQTILVIMKIMRIGGIPVLGMIIPPKRLCDAAVNTRHPL